jgi:hypothetical protein
MRGGKREGAGRPSGSRNRLTASQKRGLTDVARDYTDTAIRTLADIMCDQTATAAARVSAANAILDRAHGRPVMAAPTPTDGPALDLAMLTDDELEGLIAMLRKVEARERQTLWDRLQSLDRDQALPHLSQASALVLVAPRSDNGGRTPPIT